MNVHLHTVIASSTNMFLLLIASMFLCEILGDSTPVESSGPAKIRVKHIVGGQLIEIEKFPWIASLQLDNTHYCAGSILSETIILTVAHCITAYPIDEWIIRVGSSRFDKDGSIHFVDSVKVHENFNSSDSGLGNNLALVKVKPPIKFSRKVTNVCLPKAGDVFAPGTDVTIAGWGYTTESWSSSRWLLYTNLRIIDYAKCLRDFEMDGISLNPLGQICAAAPYTDACYSDAGGPLMIGCVQVGIISSGKGCARPQFPGVYTDVAFYIDWIKKNAVELDQLPATTQ